MLEKVDGWEAPFPSAGFLFGLLFEPQDGSDVFLHVIERNPEVSEVTYILLASYFAYSLNMKMEKAFTCEMSDILRTTRHYNPEDSKLHNHRCENLKSNQVYCVSTYYLFNT
jgi:hypothetical protein